MLAGFAPCKSRHEIPTTLFIKDWGERSQDDLEDQVNIVYAFSLPADNANVTISFINTLVFSTTIVSHTNGVYFLVT